MNVTRLTAAIKKQASLIGFDKVGIARADRLESESAHLAEWLARGYHASMAWMQRNSEKREDPRSLLPGARSVVAVAMNYYTEHEHSDDPGTGKISRYAWGNDYHAILTKRLEQLLEFISSLDPAARGKVYVDTGPVLEKQWAQRAGIGWEGKHTNVITREFGSWVFLGEIILDLDLEYDQEALDRCGTCTRCIEACPTGAIVEPYVLDSNLCISYLTIEHRGAIAQELGERFDRWIFGCDICQDVCPWNRKFATPAGEPGFQPREGNLSPRISDFTEMSPQEFEEKFRGSPVRRAKHEGMVRNASINERARNGKSS